MFGLSFTHLIILAIIVLVFIGPEQLPQVARTFARLLNEWKRASSDIQSSLTQTLRDDFSNRTNQPPPQEATQVAPPTTDAPAVEKKDEHGS